MLSRALQFAMAFIATNRAVRRSRRLRGLVGKRKPASKGFQCEAAMPRRDRHRPEGRVIPRGRRSAVLQTVMKTTYGESAGVRWIGAHVHRAHFIRRTRHFASCAEVYELNSTAGVLTPKFPSAPLAQCLIYVCSLSLTPDGGVSYICASTLTRSYRSLKGRRSDNRSPPANASALAVGSCIRDRCCD
jgi:hypothetical protein